MSRLKTASLLHHFIIIVVIVMHKVQCEMLNEHSIKIKNPKLIGLFGMSGIILNEIETKKPIDIGHKS